MNILSEDQNSKLIRNLHSHVFESYAIYESQQKLPPFNKVQNLQSLTKSSKMFGEPFQAFIQRTSMDHSQ